MKRFNTLFCLIFLFGSFVFGQDFPETKWNDFADTSWYNASATNYEILNAESLAGLSVLVANGNDFAGKTIEILSSMDLGAHLFQPIGIDVDHPFKGIVNGNGHILSNLRINQTDKDFAGLFGAVISAEFYNLILDNAIVYGKSTVGSLIANLSTNSHLEKSYAVNSVVQCEQGFYGGIAGGLVGGLLSNSSIKLCSFSGEVYGGDQIGGLVGTTWDTTLIEQSYSEGLVQGDNIVGGLVGYTTMNFPPAPNTTNVVKNCFSASNVVAIGDWAGGLFGFPETNGKIENSYSIGTVQGNSKVGASVGAIMGDTVVIKTFFDKETSGMTQGIGEFNGSTEPEITGLTTAEMKTETFADLLNEGQENIWFFNPEVNDGYPFFSGMILDTQNPVIKTESIGIYPTVSKTEIFVSTKTKTNFVIVDLLGNVIQRGSVSKGENTISVANFNKGIYLIVFKTQDGQRTVKRFIRK